MSKPTKLFEPIKLGTLELPNRIIMPAVTTHYDEDDERAANFYAEIARGGVGLIIMGAIQAIYPGRREHGKMTLNKDDDIPHLQKWTKAIHDNGGLVAAHLAVWNYWAKGGVGTPAEDVSPSGVITVQEFPQEFEQTQFIQESKPLTVEEIHMIEEQLGDAAARAVEAGFDAIELPAIAGNIISRFITHYTNRRTDEYGGSLENRLRMLLETIAIIKKKVGDDFPFICRIPGEDLMPWGLTLDESKIIAPIIERTGIHAFNIMPGWYETRQPRHQMVVPRGGFVYLAEGIKQVVNIPVAAGNRITDPLLAEQILAEGKADLIAMCRSLIADPELPNKAKEGRFEDIRMCTACCNCWDSIAVGELLACSVNARAGKESEYAITPTPKPKKVFVIGGGPGGMEAARVAALRGHQVTLFESTGKLGGQLIYAVLPPHKEEWNTLLNYLSIQIRKLGVEVRLNEEAMVRTVGEGKPDAVIMATGAVPIIPNIPGIDSQKVAMALDVLTGEKESGQNVVVVGGGLIGCETAEFLHQKGKKVTILEMLSRIAADVGSWNRWPLIDRLIEANIRMEVNEKVEEITERGIKATRDGSSEFFEADSVVIAVGMKSDDSLTKELEGKVPLLFKIGACVEPRRVKEAIEEGFKAGLQV